jgi:hypothetical protein
METETTYATAIDDQPIPVRDLRTERRFFVDNVIIRGYGPTLGVYGIAVYSALCMHANLDTQQCYPSHRTLAEMLDCSVSKVKQAIRHLEELHLIETAPRYDAKNERQTSNLYTLLEPPVPPGTTDTPPQYHEKTTMNNPHSDQSSPPKRKERGATAPTPPEPPVQDDDPPLQEKEPEKAGPPEAIQAYRAAFHSYPRKETYGFIVTAVGSRPDRLQLWTRICTEWLLRGYNKYNIKGLIECFHKGQVGNGRHDKRSGGIEEFLDIAAEYRAEERAAAYGY